VAWDLGEKAEPRPGPGGGGDSGVTYALEGAIFATGATIGWLREGIQLIDEPADVGRLAEQTPDSGGVVMVPAFTGLGSPWWDPYARGTIVGLTKGTGAAHLARAAIEAMAFQVRDVVDTMTAATGVSASHLRADGGASALDLLLQLQADQLQLPVARSATAEATALGAAMLAGLAEGVWKSLSDVELASTTAVEFQPRSGQAGADRMYGAWREAVKRSGGWPRSEHLTGPES
jgi:glycerol kinase